MHSSLNATSAGGNDGCETENPMSILRHRSCSRIDVKHLDNSVDPLDAFKESTVRTVDHWVLCNSASQKEIDEFNFDESVKFGVNDGLVELPLMTTSDEGTEKRIVFFLQDWTLLWDSLVLRKKNYMAAYIPLLYSFQEFWFSKRVLAMITLLLLWDLIISIITKIVNPAKSLLSLYTTLSLLCLLLVGGTRLQRAVGS